MEHQQDACTRHAVHSMPENPSDLVRLSSFTVLHVCGRVFLVCLRRLLRPTILPWFTLSMLRRKAGRLLRQLITSKRAAAHPYGSLCPRVAAAVSAAAEARPPLLPTAAAQSPSGWQLAAVGLLGLAGSMASGRAEAELPLPPDKEKVSRPRPPRRPAVSCSKYCQRSAHCPLLSCRAFT